MSTQIAKLECVNCELRIAQFFAKKAGLCLEMGPTNTVKTVLFTKPQVQELVKELQNWLGEVELPFYTKTRPSERGRPSPVDIEILVPKVNRTTDRLTPENTFTDEY